MKNMPESKSKLALESAPLHSAMNPGAQKPLIGWREWVALPALGVARIRAKVDTGARTSALDSVLLEEFEEDGVRRIRFELFTAKGKKRRGVPCVADVLESRWVTNSGGGGENRVVIRTPVVIGSFRKEIEITLANRASMKFRMLLGRTAIMRAFHVNPARSYLAGEPRTRIADRRG